MRNDDRNSQSDNENVDHLTEDGVELVEDCPDKCFVSADKFDSNAIRDLAKARLKEMDRERSERVAKRRHSENPVKRVLHRIIPYGGVLSSGMNLASSSIGAGIISLPYAFNTSGLAMAIVYLVVVGILTVYSYTLLAIAGKRTGLRSYEKIVRALLGKGADYFLAFVMWLLSFGAEVSYVISMGDIIKAFIINTDNSPDYLKTDSARRLMMSGVWLVAMLPLCLPKEINSLRHFSVLAVLFIVFFVICMIVHSAKNGLANGPRDDLVYFRQGNNAVHGLGIFMFAFISQLNCYEVFEEMYKPSTRQLTKSATLGTSLCFILYFCSGLFGYLDFGPDVKNSALKMYNPVADKMMAVGYAGIILKLCVGYGMHMIPVRNAIYHVCGIDVKAIAWWKNSLVCGFMALVSLICGLFLPSVTVVFGIVGGFSGGFIGFIFPALMFMYTGNWSVKTVGWGHYLGTYFLLIVGVVGVVFGTVSAVFSQISQ